MIGPRKRGGMGAFGGLLAALLGFAAGAVAAPPDETAPSRIVAALDDEGRPVASAEVVEVASLADGTLVVDEDASPLATAIEDGRAFVLVDPARPRTAVRASGRTTVLLPEGRAWAGVVLAPAAPLSGSVEVRDAALRSSLVVLAFPAEGTADLAHRTRVSETGEFSFTHLPPGTWRLRILRARGAWQDLGTVTAPGRLAPIPFLPGATLSGTLAVLPDARPVSGVTVRLVRLGSVAGPAEPVVTDESAPREARVETVSDAAGRFTFLDVPPGVYTAHLSDPQYSWEGDPPRLDVDVAGNRRIGTFWIARRGSVVGRVVDSAGAGIGEATVLVAAAPDATPVHGGAARNPTALSIENGAFRIDGIAPGSGYRVVVSAQGRSPVVLDEVEVAGGRATDLGRITLPRGWNVEALARDERGQAVPGALMTAIPAERPSAEDASDPVAAALSRKAVADADGRAVLPDLPAGPSFLRATAPGHLDGTTSVREGERGRTTTERVVLPTAPSLSGRVTGSEGPPPPVVVRATVRRTGLWRETAPLSDGTFRFEDLPPAPTDVEARLARRGTSAVVARREGAMPGSGETVLLEIAPLYRVRGTVENLRRDGGPARARLEIPRADRRRDEEPFAVVEEIALVARGSRAEFLFESVPPGPCAVRIVQGRFDSGAEALFVDDRDVDGVEILMPEGASLEGTVIDSTRLSFALGARVRLVRLEADEEAPEGLSGRPTTVADDAGRYRFSDVTPGAWRVEAWDAGTATVSVEVRLPPNGRMRAPTLWLSKGGRVEGFLKDDRGRGITGVTVRSERREDGSPGPKATTDGRGAFRLSPIAAGRWRLVTVSAATTLDGIEADVEVVEGETTTVELGADGRASLEGTVRRRGRAVPGVEVSAVLLDGRGCDAYARRAVADAYGAYRFDGLAAGRYVLRLVEGDVSTALPLWLREGDRAIRDLELGEGSIRGVVRKSSREPLRDVEIRAVPTGATRVDVSARGISAPDGTFRLDGLPVGTCRVEVWPPGRSVRVYENVFADIAPAGAPLEVVIGAGARLLARVTDGEGRPVQGAEAWVLSPSGEPTHSRPGLSSPGGRVRLDGLPDGAARVVVHAKGYGRPRPVPIVLRSEQTTEITVRLEEAGSLRVLVTAGRDALPRARVNVLRLPEGEPVAVARPLSRVDPRGLWWMASRVGEVVVDDLEDGLYRVVVEGTQELADARIDVRVISGSRTTVPVGMLLRPR